MPKRETFRFPFMAVHLAITQRLRTTLRRTNIMEDLFTTRSQQRLTDMDIAAALVVMALATTHRIGAESVSVAILAVAISTTQRLAIADSVAILRSRESQDFRDSHGQSCPGNARASLCMNPSEQAF